MVDMQASNPQTRINPFPGLRPFDVDESHLFFGREGQTDEILKRLRRHRFLAIVGTSGSGKSSLVRAGLLPSLHSGFMVKAGSNWRIAIMRPGDSPIANLAEALNASDVFGVEGDDARLYTMFTETSLRRGALGLVEVTQQSSMQPHENLLVVVDQFEELVRFKQSIANQDAGDEASAFVKLLLEAVDQDAVPIYVVLTMRSDFLGDCSQFRDLPEALNDSQYLVPRMTREQRQRAITSPIAVGGIAIASRLVNRLLNDMGDNPDQLPILQHALMRTWDVWEQDHAPGEPLDLRHYEATGSMAKALSNHADEIYHGLPSDRSRQICELMFKRLTEKASDGRGIRRLTRVGDIAAVADATPEEIIAVANAFRGPGKSFLMPPVNQALSEKTLLDISHESLMRVWERLDEWVEEEWRSARIYRRLTETATMHVQGDAGYLRDPELSTMLNWREENQPNKAWAERYGEKFESTMAFVDESVRERENQKSFISERFEYKESIKKFSQQIENPTTYDEIKSAFSQAESDFSNLKSYLNAAEEVVNWMDKPRNIFRNRNRTSLLEAALKSVEDYHIGDCYINAFENDIWECIHWLHQSLSNFTAYPMNEPERYASAILEGMPNGEAIYTTAFKAIKAKLLHEVKTSNYKSLSILVDDVLDPLLMHFKNLLKGLSR